ncbi:MAG: type II toxin-antitoxin system VapC family toxin [Brevundimonas sp.]|uniref:type II toxin-antitoxin system VapC family toxin n=1 Tax=Brevundimonas sp. TaxID=1871086 RepID=UPI002732CB2A|nr:type II toxin-antitoxin system VapC family toxin [Brevundimonas sp.]MDP3404943.1 type II toxin-antitoxin system VapC family toxin [Brevundimonas sp.]
MSLLLDTHTLMWWVWDDLRLSRRAHAAIAEADEVFVSSVSAFEIATKHRIGKLPNAGDLALDFSGSVEAEGFVELPVTWRDAGYAGRVTHPHKDPFDRMLIAQGVMNGLVLVSNEKIFDDFGVSRLW